VFGQQRARRLLQALALRQSCRFGKPAKPPPLPQAAIRRRHCNQGAAFQKRPDRHAIELRQTAQPARQSHIGLRPRHDLQQRRRRHNGHTRVAHESQNIARICDVGRNDSPRRSRSPRLRASPSAKNTCAEMPPVTSK
jgi:hypothetical protein